MRHFHGGELTPMTHAFTAALQRLTAALAILIALASPAWADSSLVTDKLNKKIDAALTDLDGKTSLLSQIKDKEAIVVVFLSFECPVSTSYSTALAELHKQYSDKGIAFIAIGASDDVAALKKQASEFKIPFPIYYDPNLDATDAFKASATPEAFVLDRNFVMRYRGRIDNAWSARLKKNAQTTEFDLKNAIDAVLAGKDVPVPATRAIGCPVLAKGAIAKTVTTSVTFHKDVEPILQTHCQQCHRPVPSGLST